MTQGPSCIVHQCNCLAVHAHGLSESIAKLWPNANVYKQRQALGARNLAVKSHRPMPGTTKLLRATDTIDVACVFGQWFPGRVGARYQRNYPQPDKSDDYSQRLAWFVEALADLGRQLAERQKDGSALRTRVVFPYKIGCGLAGGSWMSYLAEIRRFAARYEEHVSVSIVARPVDLPHLPTSDNPKKRKAENFK